MVYHKTSNKENQLNEGRGNQNKKQNNSNYERNEFYQSLSFNIINNNSRGRLTNS